MRSAERIEMTIWHRLLHKYHSIERFADRKKNVLGLVAAVAGVVAAVIAGLALIYVVRAETRGGWTEAHSTMIILKDRRASAIAEKGQAGAGMSGVPNQYVERLRDYHSADAQLRGILARNNDPLAIELRNFLDQNSQDEQWQGKQYETQFNAFLRRVEMKSSRKWLFW
jgi:hypothetical protein